MSEHKQSEELKPCPFCGGNNTRQDIIGRCLDCGSSGPDGCYKGKSSILNWNTRHSEKKVDVKELEEIICGATYYPISDNDVSLIVKAIHNALYGGGE